MGDVVDFLRARFAGTGFNKLTSEEISAVQDFMLLWSAFEAESLHSHAGPQALVALASDLSTTGKLQGGGIDGEMGYFRQRYWQSGAQTAHALDLRLDLYKPSHQKIAYDFLNGSEKNLVGVLVGLLLVIYRLRNNMFHGPKWAYGIQGQYDNFTKASAVLKWVLSL